MDFETVAQEYYDKFGKMPPRLTTLDTENKEYLKMLKEAIEEGTELTRNDLGEVFMPDNNLYY